MALTRVSAPTYSTRRKKQLPTSRASSAPPEVISTTRCPDVSCLKYELHSTQDDADDILRNAFLAGKEGHEEGKQDYNTGAVQRVAPFPCPRTMSYTAPTESSPDSTPLPIHMELREMIFEKLQNTPLLCSHPATESGDAVEATALDKSTHGSQPGMLLTKSPNGENAYKRETSPKKTDSQTGFPEFVSEELSAQKDDACSNEAPPDETEKDVCHPMLPDSVEQQAVSETKVSPDVDKTPVVELRTTFDKEMETHVSTTVPDEPSIAEDAGGLSEGHRTSKKRRCSVLSNTRAPGGDLGECPNEEAPKSAVAVQVDAPGGECTESRSPKGTFLDGILATSAEKATSVCQLMKAKEVACKEEDPIRPSKKTTGQQTPAKLLSAVSPPTVQRETFATTTVEGVASSQESSTVMQQNTTALIKRRRCGSLGLDQSLRWQAMARRVPRIKGVCYSTTRHEWIAVGPLQAGSARKKNIYFSVPKHGFDGARRLAVECRRRLQAGVPVNVPEFVREQQLLFQSETTAKESAGVAASVPDAGSLAEEVSTVDNHDSLGAAVSGTPQSLSKKLSGSTCDSSSGAASQAQGCGRPEKPLTPASNGRRRQRPRSVALGPLQRDIAQRLLQGEGGTEEVPEEWKKQRGTQKGPEGRERSQMAVLTTRWHGYSARENSKQVPAANKHKGPRDADTPAPEQEENTSGKTSAHIRSSCGSGILARTPIDRADVSMDADGLETGPARRRVTDMLERGGSMEGAYSIDNSAFSTAARLAIMARRTALQSDESASAAALLSSDAYASESGCSCSTEGCLQLWGSALNHTTQLDGQITEHSKLCSEKRVVSEFSAVLTGAYRDNLKDACLPCPGAVLRSFGFTSRTNATHPEVHVPFQSTGYPCKQGRSGRGGLQQQRYASFPANDYYGRRSSTTSSAGSRSAGAGSLSEPNCENPDYSLALKDSSGDSDPNKNTLPEKHLSKPWRRGSFSGEALHYGGESQVEQGRIRNGKCPTVANRRLSAASALSRASENVDTSGETITMEMTCSPSNRRRNLVDLLNPAGTLAGEDLTDPKSAHVYATADGSGRLSNVDGSQTVAVRVSTDAAAVPALAYCAKEGARATTKEDGERSPLRSVSLGNAFTSTATLGCPVSFGYSCAPNPLECGEQASGVSHPASGRISPLQEIQKANFDYQELDNLEDANLALQDPEAGMLVSHGESRVSVHAKDTEEASAERECGADKLTAKGTVAAEFSPLVKALCLMLVDLLRFCTCSPVALTRAGLQPSQIAFCKNEGVRVLRTALQDVSATRTVSRRFRAYLDVFEDSILANALPTSGGVADIMRYLYRLKQSTEGRTRRPEHARNDKPTTDTSGGPKCDCGPVKAEQSLDICTGRAIHDTNDHSAVRRTDWPTCGRRSQKWSEVCVSSAHMDEPEKSSSGQVRGGKPARDTETACKVQHAAGDANRLLNSPVTSAVSSWHLPQRPVDEEAEQPGCADEEKLSGQQMGAVESLCVESYHGPTTNYANAAQPDNDQTPPKSMRSSSSRWANILTDIDTVKAFQSLEKRRATDCPDSPDTTHGGRLPVGRAADYTGGMSPFSGKTHTGSGETTSCTFRTWRQLVVEALQEAKSFEDLRRSEAMKQLLTLCVPVQSASPV